MTEVILTTKEFYTFKELANNNGVMFQHSPYGSNSIVVIAPTSFCHQMGYC